jgi:aspartate/methionine/tyrosine aminotransferase
VFPRIEYLAWIDGRPAATTHDLGSSGLRPRGTGVRTAVVPDRLAEFETPSGVDLRASVAEVYGVDPARVVLAPGATAADLLVAATAIDLTSEGPDLPADDVEAGGPPEDPPQVLVEKPGYEALVATPSGLGARVDRFRRPPEDRYALEPDRVEGALGDRPALVTVTNRHNPSGRETDRERLREVAERVAAAGAHLLVDEVFAPYVADAGEGAGTAFGGVTAAGLPGTVVTGSLSKFHGLEGLRVGWLVAPETFAERARTVAAHLPALSGPSTALAARALANHETVAAECRDLVGRNAALLREFVDGRPDLSGPTFEGSTLAFLGHEAGGDAVAEVAAERDLLVVPGRFFDDDDRFRVSLARPTRAVRESLAVLEDTLDAL